MSNFPTVSIIEFHLSDGSSVSASFSEYGWQQWGASEEILGYVTMPLLEAIEKGAAENPELCVILEIREEDEETEEGDGE